jgi:hypothetical protein
VEIDVEFDLLRASSAKLLRVFQASRVEGEEQEVSCVQQFDAVIRVRPGSVTFEG